jgi:ATP-dependent Clp protease ATP-binding subunit ClpA
LLPVSDRARQALLRAEDEARSLNHSYVGTEHILLALIFEPRGAAARILLQLDADAAAIRSAVTAARSTSPKLRLSGGAFCPVSRALPGLGAVWLLAT